MKSYSEKIRESAEFLEERLGPPPQTAIVFGTGLGIESPEDESGEEMEFAEIPHFPGKNLKGHRRVFRLAGGSERVGLLHGRYHLYEGMSPQQVAFPVRVMSEWGVRNFFLTNAAASLRNDMRVGEMMLIRDHIGLYLPSPLPWPGIEGDEANFVDMVGAYDRELRKIALKHASFLGIRIHEGVYAALPGPAFETPAEIDLLRLVKADAVGMSTVPEVVALRHLGKKVLGISCFTNYGAGMKSGGLSHSEVVSNASKSSSIMQKLLLSVAQEASGKQL